MKKLFFLSVLLLVFGFFLLGCDGPASNPIEAPLADENHTTSLAKASTQTQSFKQEFAGGQYVSCAGEIIFTTGYVHHVHHVTLDNNGGYHYKWHMNVQSVSAVGLTTGYKYQWVNVINNQEFSGIVGQTYTSFGKLKVIGQGDVSNFAVQLTLHTTVNANGEVTAEVYNYKYVCD